MLSEIFRGCHTHAVNMYITWCACSSFRFHCFYRSSVWQRYIVKWFVLGLELPWIVTWMQPSGMASSSLSGRTPRTGGETIGSHSLRPDVFFRFPQYPDETLVALSCWQDLSKYSSMSSSQVDSALKASNYLAKWVDWGSSKLWSIFHL